MTYERKWARLPFLKKGLYWFKFLLKRNRPLKLGKNRRFSNTCKLLSFLAKLYFLKESFATALYQLDFIGFLPKSGFFHYANLPSYKRVRWGRLAGPFLKYLKFWGNVHHPLCVTYHMARVTCHLAPVTCPVSHFYKLAELFVEESVLNGAPPASFVKSFLLISPEKTISKWGKQEMSRKRFISLGALLHPPFNAQHWEVSIPRSSAFSSNLSCMLLSTHQGLIGFYVKQMLLDCFYK